MQGFFHRGSATAARDDGPSPDSSTIAGTPCALSTSTSTSTSTATATATIRCRA